MLEFLQNYGIFIIIALIASGIFTLIAIKEPQKIKEWLIWACAQAELSLGGGTGMLKLREVYDMFITQYPIVSKFVPFSIFQKWTEESLVIFKNWVANNMTQTLFPGDDNNEKTEK